MPAYSPKPIDTSDIKLPPDLEELTERLAENVHDNWSMARLSDGWKLGGTRDDRAKLHPNLVPYSELAEVDRDYDRRTALETLKSILKLGYRVER